MMPYTEKFQVYLLNDNDIYSNVNISKVTERQLLFSICLVCKEDHSDWFATLESALNFHNYQYITPSDSISDKYIVAWI